MSDPHGSALIALSPLSAWRVSLHRMRSDWPIVAAAWLITLLAAILLAAGPIYSDAVSLAGLRRVLFDAPVVEANLEATALVPAGELEFASAEVGREIRGALGSVPADIERSGRSETFGLPQPRREEVRDLAILGFIDGIGEHAEIMDGSWPETAADGPVQVAVAQPIAEALGWEIGDEHTLTDRRDETRTIDVRLVGVFALNDPSDPFWWGEEMLIEGWTETQSFRTFGPMVTTRDELLGRVVDQDVRITWHAFPRFGLLTLDQVAGLRAGASEVPQRLEFALSGSFPTADTGLDEILVVAERSLLVSRTGVLLLIVQLAILAAYAIVLTSGLLAEHRRTDTALLRSRGAGPLQVAAIALVEALVLAVPAALLAPFLAGAVLGAFNMAGPLAAAGVEIVPQLSDTAFQVAAAAALGAALLLVLPAFLAARSFVDEEGRRSRAETRTIGQRLGIDFALLAVTLIGLWQLRLYGAPLTQTVQGTLGLDPLLVAAPAIGLLAGGVLALRIVPLLATAAEAITRRGRRLVGALGAQQVARRPLRYTRAALLLMLAVSMGVFAISYADTWQTSQQDQAAYQVGADVRLTATAAGGAVPAWALEAALRRVPGVMDVTPVERDFLRIPAGTRQGELLAMDASSAAGVVAMRGDLTSVPLADLLAPLAEARPGPAFVRLDPTPRRMRIEGRLDVRRLRVLEFDEEAQAFTYNLVDAHEVGRVGLGAEVVLRDASGLIQRFTTAPQPWDPAGQAIVVDMSAATPRGEHAIAEIGGAFTGPVELLAIDLTVDLPPSVLADEGRVELIAVSASTSDEGSDWQSVGLDGAGGWAVRVLRNQGPLAEPLPGQVQDSTFILGGEGPTGALVGPDQPGARPPAVSFVASSVPPLADDPLPVVVNPAFLDATSTAVGDEIPARVGGLLRTLRIAGELQSFPTTEREDPQAVADLATAGIIEFAQSQGTITPLEWWVSTEPGAGDEVAAALDAGPYVAGTVASRIGRAAQLSADPVALGIIGALSLGFVVAGLFAVIGLTVSAAVSARQRRTEFALLRALGLSSGQLSGWLWLENAGIVAVSLAAGTGLGLLIGWVVLPFVTVTQEAAAPFPPPLINTPWESIGLLVAISALALGVTVLVLARVLRRVGIGSVLRMGED